MNDRNCELFIALQPTTTVKTNSVLEFLNWTHQEFRIWVT